MSFVIFYFIASPRKQVMYYYNSNDSLLNDLSLYRELRSHEGNWKLIEPFYYKIEYLDGNTWILSLNARLNVTVWEDCVTIERFAQDYIITLNLTKEIFLKLLFFFIAGCPLSVYKISDSLSVVRQIDDTICVMGKQNTIVFQTSDVNCLIHSFLSHTRLFESFYH